MANLSGGISEEEKLRVIQQMAQKRSRVAMTSGGKEPVLDSTGGIHSVFAQTFIDVLTSNVGLLPAQDMYLLLRRRVTATAMRTEGQQAQAPDFAPIKYAGHEAGEFVFVRKG
jgi:hypothetical protein